MAYLVVDLRRLPQSPPLGGDTARYSRLMHGDGTADWGRLVSNLSRVTEAGGADPPNLERAAAEAEGWLSSVESLGLINDWVRIDMVGRAESLNVAMAATLLAYEARSSRS